MPRLLSADLRRTEDAEAIGVQFHGFSAKAPRLRYVARLELELTPSEYDRLLEVLSKEFGAEDMAPERGRALGDGRRALPPGPIDAEFLNDEEPRRSGSR